MTLPAPNNDADPSSVLPEKTCQRFTLAQIQSATHNFDETLVIGRGGFGKVYKCLMIGSVSEVVVKRLHSMSDQGPHEFETEVKILSKLRHGNLVALIGYCNEENEMTLVYEFMPNGTLEENLHKPDSCLSWLQLLKISIAAARGLDYLHAGTSTQHGVIHRDVKSSNILLDANFDAKISDFGLAKIGLIDRAHVSTAVKGTFGYMDPSYFYTGKLTRKSDVYAFGVVLFEVLSGRKALDSSLEERWGLVGWAQHQIKQGKLNQIVDPRLIGQISRKCLKDFASIAGRCLHSQPKQRPNMSEVVFKLESILSQEIEIADSVVDEQGFVYKLRSLFTGKVGAATGNKSDSSLHHESITDDISIESYTDQSYPTFTYDHYTDPRSDFKYSPISALGSSGVLADHQLQAQLQEHHTKGPSQLTISDIARKAFLYSHFMEGHAKSAPISRMPLITILDTKNYLKDIPVCQPLHLELNFFSKENRVLLYPTRAFYIEGVNLMAYNMSTGADTIYKKLFPSMPGNVEFHGKHLLHSRKQHLFLVVYEFNGASSEVVLYWENTNSQSSNSKANTIKGRDAAFIGLNDGQFAILDEDKIELSVYTLPGGSPNPKPTEKNMIDDQKPYEQLDVSSIKGPLQFTFETEVDRIFSTPVESTLMFACFGDKIGMGKLVQGYSISTSDGPNMSTKGEGKKSIKLKSNEIVLQVHWQETLRGSVAGILTTQRVLIASADLDILASTSTKFDKGLPSYRSLLWVGPALLFSTTTAVSVLGWDGKVRTILSSSMPNAALMGTLNDLLLLANPTEISPSFYRVRVMRWHCTSLKKLWHL